MMSIKESTNANTFVIKVQERSRQYPHIRVQKQVTLSGPNVTIHKAKQKEKELQFMCIEEIKKREGSDITFREIIDRWYDYKFKEGFVTRETVGDYHRALEKWCFAILKTPCNDITIYDVKSILRYQKEQGISRSFRCKFKSMINNVFK